MNSIQVWTGIFFLIILFGYVSIERTKTPKSLISRFDFSKVVINCEEFKPLIIYYNRVGKCGSRSLLSVISGISKKNGFDFVSETPLYQERGTNNN